MAAKGTSRPIAALLSQGLVAGSSLVLQIIAFDQLGTSGLGSFALLFGILITVNSVQSGWIGDSLTVLDRFEPGLRRALIQSQVAVVVLTFAITAGLGFLVTGDVVTAAMFSIASIAWVVEETFRRLLIARREFWKLALNDAAFALGSLGFVGIVIVGDTTFTLDTLVLALLAGAIAAIGLGVAQLPRIEISRGILAPSRMRDLSSFAFWRAAQIGLRPGSQTAVRFVVTVVASRAALGEIEAARLLLAPVLTVVNGAGVYLLPTYSAQAKRAARFRPAVPLAMLAVGGIAAAYGAVAVALRTPLIDLLSPEASVVTVTALVAWTLYSVGFGAGVPAGNAMVATGRSRTAFFVRCADATIGVAAASILALAGWTDAVPAGLAAGTFVGAALLLRSLMRSGRDVDLSDGETPDAAVSSDRQGVDEHDGGDADNEAVDRDSVGAALFDADVVSADIDDAPWIWQPAEVAAVPARAPDTAAALTLDGQTSADRRRAPFPEYVPDVAAGSKRAPLQERLVWLVPLVMIVATEYKVRRRSIDEALSGAVDPLIAVELLIYGMIGAWAIWRLAPTKPRLTPLMLVMWGYILSTAVSALYSTFPLLAMARAVQLVIIGAVLHLVATQGTVVSLMKMLHGWIVLLSVSILIGLAYVAPTTNAQIGRFTWLSVHSVSAGSMLAVSVCALFGMWLLQPAAARTGQPLPWPRNAYALLLVFHFVFLLMTRTRGSIGGAAIALAVMAWVGSGNKMRPQLLLGSLVAGGALVLAFGDVILEFLTRGESAESIGTFNRRTEIWTLAWDSFLSHPLHGLGFTSAKGVFFDETGLGGAHNALINVMIDTGIVGLAWWLTLLGATIVVLHRQWSGRRVDADLPGGAGTARADHLILMGIFVATLLNSVTTEGLGAGVNVSAIWWFVSVSWLTILDRSQHQRDAERSDIDRVVAQL